MATAVLPPSARQAAAVREALAGAMQVGAEGHPGPELPHRGSS